MSWNPSPSLGGANWSGNAQLATKQQLLSSITGLYDDLKDFNFSTISVSTLTVPDWISTSKLYVSDIRAQNIDISGIAFDASGLLYAPQVSSQFGIFQNITNVSVMQLTFKPTFTGNIEVTFDLGLGQAIGGFLAGLGAAVGGGLIAVGTGVGLAIQGAEQGLATIIAGRPENFITNNTYETINFTSQLQVSTLGNANIAYSSIFRTVSSVSANSVPGREIFTSTLFYPGQICIRSVSDPINLITGDSNVNTSTIQSFGQWVPLTGLEPDNIIANTAIINTISTGILSTGTLQVLSNAQLNYNVPLNFDLGGSGDASINGYLNQWNFQTNQPIKFLQLGDPGTLTPGASLTLGTGFQSLLEVSSITAPGNIQANTGYFSTLVANELVVVSTFSTVYTIVACNVVSTSIVEAYLTSTINLQAQYVAPFQFSSILGNPTGPFDLNKFDSVISTTYNSVSSLTQNILNYQLYAKVNDQQSFNPYSATAQEYIASPNNVQQWESTMIICSPGADITALLSFSYPSSFFTIPLTGKVSLTVDMTQQSFGFGAQQYVGTVPGQGYNEIIPYIPPTTGFFQTYTLTCDLNGIWSYVTPATPPPITENSNVFQIYQDVNDTYITATDRLHIEAGDILLQGTLNLNNVNLDALNVEEIDAQVGFFSTIYTSTIIANPMSPNGGLTSYFHKKNISFNDPPTQVTPVTLTFSNDSPDFIPIFTLIPNFMGNNYFTSYNYTNWNNTLWNNPFTSAYQPAIYCGDLQQPLGSYSAFFYINNTIASPAYSLPVYYINSSGSNLLGNIAGNTYAQITTTNGTSWTLTPNINNPVSFGGSYNNVFQITQQTSQTQITNTQNFVVQSPNTNFITGTMGLFADQIRVNSHKYGLAESTGLNSFPIGIENTVYIDGNMAFSNVPSLSDFWQSDATNALTNVTSNIFYDINSWIVQIIPSRFRTNSNLVCAWDVQPTILANTGGTGYVWGYNRYIQLRTGPGGPGSNANNWNWIIAFPKNYCTYT